MKINITINPIDNNIKISNNENIIHPKCLGQIENTPNLNPIKISYARLDIISAQSKFTTTTYARSPKETQSQDRHSVYPGNHQGDEYQTKIPQYMCIR